MDALILAAIPRRSRIIRSLGNSGGLLTQNALLVDVPSGWIVGQQEVDLPPGRAWSNFRVARHSAKNRVWLPRSSDLCSRGRLPLARNGLCLVGNRILGVWFRSTLLTAYIMR